jgi:hypothetical protein
MFECLGFVSLSVLDLKEPNECLRFFFVTRLNERKAVFWLQTMSEASVALR